MSLGISTISELAIGETPFNLDQSVGSSFRELLKNNEAQFINLIEISPYDTDKKNSVLGSPPISTTSISSFNWSFTGGVVNRYYSDVAYVTEPSESPANTIYAPLASNAYQFDVSILNGDDFRNSGSSFGAVRILNGDGENDDLADLSLEGRRIQILAGTPDFTRDQFEAVFDGFIGSPEFDEDEIILNLRTKEIFLESDFVQNVYDGTGGLEGGTDLEGSVKPLVYGEVKNIKPVLLDGANLVYQAHDGAIQSIDNVYDRGVALVNEGDVADITAASVSAGHYKTQLSGGYIKLGSSPDGLITVDAKGDSNGGYVDKIGAIMKRLVETKLGSKNFGTNDIDEGALNDFDTATGTAGIYLDNDTDITRIFDELVFSLQAYWTFTRDGRLTAGVIDEPSANSAFTIDDNLILDDTLEIINIVPPDFKTTIGYAKSNTVQSEEELAAGATADQRFFAIREFRNVFYTNNNSIVLSGKKKDRKFNTLLVNKSDAESALTRISGLFSKTRKVYKFQVIGLLFRVFVGDVITLKTDSFGLSNGQNFIITAISEDAETQVTELEVWG